MVEGIELVNVRTPPSTVGSDGWTFWTTFAGWIAQAMLESGEKRRVAP
jgi:hypothetical protein